MISMMTLGPRFLAPVLSALLGVQLAAESANFKGYYRVPGGKWQRASITLEDRGGLEVRRPNGRADLLVELRAERAQPRFTRERSLPIDGLTYVADFSEENLRKIPGILIGAAGMAVKEIVEHKADAAKKGGNLAAALTLTGALALAGVVFVSKDKKSYVSVQRGLKRFDVRVRNDEVLEFREQLQVALVK